MTSAPVNVMRSAAALPDDWDTVAGDNYFLKRDSLVALESANPCDQRYHFTGDSGYTSIAVTYRHRINLLSFGVGALYLPVTIVGIPCSVSCCGYRFYPDSEAAMVSHLRGLRGMKLVPNSGEEEIVGFTSGFTLPSCVLNICWRTFSEYISSMRSHYRYRVRKAIARWDKVEAKEVRRSDFGDDLYPLFESVYSRSKFKLEKLGISFFQTFPAEIVQFSVGGEIIAFVQMLRKGSEMIFMFAGMDYGLCERYDTYMNILLYIIRRGIDGGCRTIDLGQTTEAVKGRLGCQLAEKRLHAAHSNPLFNRALKRMSKWLGYSYAGEAYNVFN